MSRIVLKSRSVFKFNRHLKQFDFNMANSLEKTVFTNRTNKRSLGNTVYGFT